MKIVIGITGASGSIYAKRTIEALYDANHQIIVVASKHGQQVFEFELNIKLSDFLNSFDSRVEWVQNDAMFSHIASGSYPVDAYVIVPCSMSTLGMIHAGITNSLLTRSCDVALKEQRQLILVTRETPLNQIHLKNMYEVAKAGAQILPASPGFYHHPQTYEQLVDFVVGKVLDALKIENTLFKKWEI